MYLAAACCAHCHVPAGCNNSCYCMSMYLAAIALIAMYLVAAAPCAMCSYLANVITFAMYLAAAALFAMYLAPFFTTVHIQHQLCWCTGTKSYNVGAWYQLVLCTVPVRVHGTNHYFCTWQLSRPCEGLPSQSKQGKAFETISV